MPEGTAVRIVACLAGIGLVAWGTFAALTWAMQSTVYSEPPPTTAVSPARRALTHLVVVAGHAVYTAASFATADENNSWLLMRYQRRRGTAASFVQHIRAGVEVAVADPHALLVFSGGSTRVEAGDRSEGGSYFAVAAARDWFHHPEVAARAIVEDRARDSLENLLFSICRFREVSGAYPEQVTVVSYEFKRARFIDLHARALRLPLHKVAFIGTDALDAEGARLGEAATVAAFEEDMYGCAGSLASKKLDRDPFQHGAPSGARCPALKPFLSGPCLTAPYAGALPWHDGVPPGAHGETALRFRRSAVESQARQLSP